MERRLAAIPVADVAGFSRLAEAAEEASLAGLARLRADVVDPAIARHGGRIVKTTGDGLLASFASVVEAVRCAASIQATQTADEARAEGSLTMRIGVHAGDVVVEGDDLLGDGVNVAARLEQLARPGGVCVSAAVHDQVRDRLQHLRFRDGGEQTLRNIVRPLRVWHLDPGASALAVPPPGDRPVAAASGPPPKAAGDRPSLAVLPFANLSGDAGQDDFSDGITEEIVTAASRFHGLLLIARNASFTMRGREDDARKVGAELGPSTCCRGASGVRRSAFA